MAAAIADNKPGELVEVKFYRSGKLITRQIKLGVRPASLDSSPADQGGPSIAP